MINEAIDKKEREVLVMKKSVVAVIGGLVGAVAGSAAASQIMGKTIEQKKSKVDKFKSYYSMLNQWLVIKQEGKSIEQYFIDNNYKTIAIYGMGEMGNRLFDDLKGSNIEVKYAIDKQAAGTYAEVEVLEPEENLPEVDVVVITAIFACEEIEEELGELVDYPIISLEDVIYETC